MSMQNDTEFTIKCKMRARWVPHFLGMLKTMQQLGSLGSSRQVTLFADGDGDFRPKFEWDKTLPEPAKSQTSETYYYDAG